MRTEIDISKSGKTRKRKLIIEGEKEFEQLVELLNRVHILELADFIRNILSLCEKSEYYMKEGR